MPRAVSSAAPVPASAPRAMRAPAGPPGDPALLFLMRRSAAGARGFAGPDHDGVTAVRSPSPGQPPDVSWRSASSMPWRPDRAAAGLFGGSWTVTDQLLRQCRHIHLVVSATRPPSGMEAFALSPRYGSPTNVEFERVSTRWRSVSPPTMLVEIASAHRRDRIRDLRVTLACRRAAAPPRERSPTWPNGARPNRHRRKAHAVSAEAGVGHDHDILPILTASSWRGAPDYLTPLIEIQPAARCPIGS